MSEVEINLWELLYEAMGFHRDLDAEAGEARPAETQLLRNPSSETNATFWNLGKVSWAAGDLAQASLPESIPIGSGAYGLHVTATKDASATVRTLSVAQSSALDSVEPGKPYSLGLPVWVADAIAGGFACWIDWYTAASVFISASVSSPIFSGTGTAMLKVENQIAPATASFATVVLAGTSTISGDILDLWTDAWQFNPGEELAPYIDGDQPGCTWNGTPHASASTRAAVDTTFSLRKICEAVCTPMQPVYDLVRERDDQKGWTVLLDPDECPVEFLPYLAQWTGVRPQPSWSEEHLRNEIKQPTSWKRGQPEAIRLTAQRTLTGSKLVIMRERTPEAGNLYIRTLLSETPDPSRVKRDLEENVPAWILLDYEAIEGVTVADVAASAKWETVADLAAAWSSVEALAAILPSNL